GGAGQPECRAGDRDRPGSAAAPYRFGGRHARQYAGRAAGLGLRAADVFLVSAQRCGTPGNGRTGRGEPGEPQPILRLLQGCSSATRAPIRAAARADREKPQPMLTRLALPPAAALLTLSERSTRRRSSSTARSPRSQPCTATI